MDAEEKPKTNPSSYGIRHHEFPAYRRMPVSRVLAGNGYGRVFGIYHVRFVPTWFVDLGNDADFGNVFLIVGHKRGYGQGVQLRIV